MGVLFSTVVNKFNAFKDCDAAAVAVDWVVVTGAVVGMGLGGVGLVGAGSSHLGNSIETSLSDAVIAYGQDLVLNGEFLPTGFNTAFSHYVNYENILDGWNVLSEIGQRVDVVPYSYYNFLRDALGPDGFAIDMVGEPGEFLDIAQNFEVANGQAATIRFTAAAAVPNHRTEVYWGGELIGVLDPDNVSEDTFQNFEFSVQGETGDGSNQLRFRATDGTVYGGTLLTDVRVN